jgi:hypothetical protein
MFGRMTVEEWGKLLQIPHRLSLEAICSVTKGSDQKGAEAESDVQTKIGADLWAWVSMDDPALLQYRAVFLDSVRKHFEVLIRHGK